LALQSPSERTDIENAGKHPTYRPQPVGCCRKSPPKKFSACETAEVRLEFTEQEAEKDKPREIDEDWIFKFAEYAQKVSEKDVQSLWGRALSSAAMQGMPKLSASALQTLGLFDKSIAEGFRKFVAVVARLGFVPHLPAGEPEPQQIDLGALQDLGLIAEELRTETCRFEDFAFEDPDAGTQRVKLLQAHRNRDQPIRLVESLRPLGGERQLVIISRTHFLEARAALWGEGELVHLDELVLHDAGMDARVPTHELTRAHAVLRARRRIAAAPPEWTRSSAALATLQGRDPVAAARTEVPQGQDADDNAFNQLLASVDAANARVTAALADRARSSPRAVNPLVYDPDCDETEQLKQWRDIVEQTRSLPATLAGAIALDAWRAIAPLQHASWLGPLLAAALLRDRGKARHHLPCLHEGLKAIPRQRRLECRAAGALVFQLESIAAAAATGLKDHDRLANAHTLLRCKLDGRRATSHLPELLDYVIARPLVSADMIAHQLGISGAAARDLIRTLGLHEMTGRRRYRAWSIL